MPRNREQRLIVGRLVEHGRAPYQFRSGEDLSYFAKLLTQQGERVLWGKDLERAIASASTQPRSGDVIGARRVGRDTVTIMARERDANGRVIGQTAQLAHRQRWVVEKVGFFAERARLARRVRDAQLDAKEAVKAHPELASTFLTLRGAEELAARRIADPNDRERFMVLVREAIAGSVKKGEPLPSVKLRESKTPAMKRLSHKDDRTR